MSLRQLKNNSRDKQREYVIKKFSMLYKHAKGIGINKQHARISLLSPKDLKQAILKYDDQTKIRSGRVTLKKLLISVLFLLTILPPLYVYHVLKIRSFEQFNYDVLKMGHQCASSYFGFIKEIQRPVMNCSGCRSLTKVPVEMNISKEDFMSKYAYTSVPVLIKGATHDWMAMSTFNFQFFKNLFINSRNNSDTTSCVEFMPYSTKFESLDAFFNMSEERAAYKDGEDPWYIGWSNCKQDIRTMLRQHYKKPYFLPNDSESSGVDWLFMGGPGPGVPVHLDHIIRTSWQAQISGTKTWTLIPVPECESQCKTMSVTVHTGDIVVVNTNDWYHTTWIEPGELCISIGSEFD